MQYIWSYTVVIQLQDENVGNAEMEIEILDEFVENVDASSYHQSSSFSSLESSSTSRHESATPCVRRPKKAKVTQEDIYAKIISLLDSKDKRERAAEESQQQIQQQQQQVQQQMLANQRMLAEAIAKLGEGLTNLSKVAELMLKK